MSEMLGNSARKCSCFSPTAGIGRDLGSPRAAHTGASSGRLTSRRGRGHRGGRRRDARAGARDTGRHQRILVVLAAVEGESGNSRLGNGRHGKGSAERPSSLETAGGLCRPQSAEAIIRSTLGISRGGEQRRHSEDLCLHALAVYRIFLTLWCVKRELFSRRDRQQTNDRQATAAHDS